MFKKCHLFKILKVINVILFFNSACGQIENNRDSLYTTIPVQFSKISGTVEGNSDLNLEGAQNSLELISPTSYTLLIEGCASGYSANVSEAISTISILKTDSNCLAKLTQFSFDGNVYRAQSENGFSSYLEGDVATFVNQTNQNDTLSVRVKAQLSSPILSTDKVSYVFGSLRGEAVSTVTAEIVSQSQNFSLSGQNALNFNLDSTSPSATVFKGLDDNSAGLFQFNLICNLPMTNVTSANSFCPTLNKSTTQGCDLTDIAYKLVKDSYGVYAGNQLTGQQIQEIFNTKGTSVSDSDDKINRGSNKGFSTKVLTGPRPMVTNLYMVLILSCNDLSYQYFPIIAQPVTR